MNVDPYADAAAVLRAVADAARGLSPSRRGVATRQFVHDRFLCRVFTDDGWVLKGGTALLARVRDARHSLDVDLWTESGDLDAAVESLRRAAALDLGDHLRFELDEPTLTKSGRQILVSAFAGARRLESFKIDLVAGSIITAPVEEVRPGNRIELPRLGDAAPYRLYPLVDHIADKVCAIHEMHGDKRSTRSRDLVDVLVIAATQRVDSRALIVAIDTERRHRGLGEIARLDPPPEWASTIGRPLRDVVDLVSASTFDSAVEAARDFLDPILDGSARGFWDPEARQWIE